MTPKEWDIFFYCETSCSLNIGKVLSMISFYVSFHLLSLSKALGELGQKIEIHLHWLAKFTKCFRQVQKEKVFKKIMTTSAEP